MAQSWEVVRVRLELLTRYHMNSIMGFDACALGFGGRRFKPSARPSEQDLL